MFCKNCGREIDRKTLEKLIRPTGESALCPNCGQVLDTAEFCGGFWGLIASGEAMDGAAEAGSRTGERSRAGHRNAGVSAGKSDFSGSAGSVGSRKRAGIPGATEADRVFARLILEGEEAGDGIGGAAAGAAAGAAVREAVKTNENAASRHASKADSVKAGGDTAKRNGAASGRDLSKADSVKAGGDTAKRNETASGRDLSKADSVKAGKGTAGSGKGAGNTAKSNAAGAEGSKNSKRPGTGDSGKRGGYTPPWLVSAALALVAVIAGILIGRVLPRSSGSGTAAGAESAQTASTVAALADSSTGEEKTENGEDSIPPDNKADENADIAGTAEAVADSAGSGATAAAAAGESPADGEYNKIRRSLTDVGGTLIEDAVLYLGTQDSGIVFDGEKLSNEWLSTADGTAYIRKEIRASDGVPEEIQEIYCDSSGAEKNNSAGYARVKYEYDSEGVLERKKYYAVTADGENDEKIFTSECGTVETDEGTVAVEIIEPVKEGDENSAFRYRKIERTFMSENSDLPGALEAVRYYTGETDSVAAKEEIHEYSRVDESPSDEAGYDYYVEETIRSTVRNTGAGNGSENPETGESAGQEAGISGTDNPAYGFSGTETVETVVSGAESSESENAEADISEAGISGAANPVSDNSDLDASEAGIFGEHSSETENPAAGISGGETFGEDSAEAKTAQTIESGAAGTTDAAANPEEAGEDFTEKISEITIRYFFETTEDRPRLVRMGFYEDDVSILGGAGFSYLIRSYNEDGTVIEDTFFTASGETVSESEAVPAVLTSEDPLLSDSAIPGWISKERPWMFPIP